VVHDALVASGFGGLVVSMLPSGTGGLVVSMLPSGTPRSRVQTRPKPSDIFGRKNPQHAFLRKGSEAVCTVS
jgi:hypothetical protein